MRMTSEQRAAVEARAPRVCVTAGAGSGKTFVLVEHILYLIEHGLGSLENIAAITFTDKAAAQMKARLRGAFRARAPKEDPEEMNRWREFERRVDTARISTIHGFCARLLQENALFLGRDPDFAVLTEPESDLLRRRVVRDTLHALYEQDDPAALAIAQYYPTKKIVSEIIELLGSQSLVEQIARRWELTNPMALRAAWEALLQHDSAERLRTLPRNPALRRWRAELERWEGQCEHPEDNFEQWRLKALRIIDELEQNPSGERIQQLGRDFCDVEGKAKRNSWPDRDYIRTRIKKLEAQMEELLPVCDALDTQVAQQYAEATANFMRVYHAAAEAYETAKQAQNALDFDDLIVQAWRLLRDNDELRQRVARSLKHLLIDEFQDTDRAQAAIAQLLQQEEGGPSVYYVGDAKQSIYAWRGAEVQVFQEEIARVGAPLPLSSNFRTLPDVLAFVNSFFQKSGLLWQVEEYQAMRASRDVLGEARVETLLVEVDEKLKADERRKAEAALVAARIRAMCSDSDAVSVYDEARKDFRTSCYGDIALLFRSMSNIRIYEQALRDADIPYVISSGRGFFTQQEVIDLANLLKLLVDPRDENALLACLRSPIGGLSDEALLKLTRDDRRLCAAFAAEDVPDDFADGERASLARLQHIVEELRALLELPLPNLLEEAIQRTGLEAIYLSQSQGLQKASNIRKIVELAESFSRRQPPTLPAFLSYLDDLRQEQVRESDAPLQPHDQGAVTLMTVHKSKGLEYPVVFVCDMEADRNRARTDRVLAHRELGLVLDLKGSLFCEEELPITKIIKTRQQQEGEAEEARLLYVAMTRARDYLVLCGSRCTEATPANSWFAHFAEYLGLFDGSKGELIDGDGWRVRVCTAPVAAGNAAWRDDAPKLPPAEALLRRAAPLPEAVGEKRVVSVSRLLDAMSPGLGAQEPQRESEAAFSLERRRALTRGDLVHRMFEWWDFKSPPPIEAVLAEAQPGILEGEALARELARVAETFNGFDCAEAMRTAARIEREAPFLLSLGGTLLSGTVDALADRRLLVDYKTGGFKADSHARYAWQLQLYAAAIRALLGTAPERAVLCYVDAAREEAVSLTAGEIDAALNEARRALASLRAVN